MSTRHPLRTALVAATAVALAGGLLTLTEATAGAAASGTLTDFNGDGIGDLAVSAPHATVSSQSNAGAVVVTYGTTSGLSSTKKKVITQATSGVPGAPETDDAFGTATAVGDFDDDGKADLSVGAPGENNYDGAVWSLRGSASGITTTGSVSYGAGTLGVPTTGQPQLGSSITG
ncbi:hypothetical protein ABT009_10510 [Streptomyces sp. NPDC002896]|uniref:hypothetical protein n=1 Tax=Streptomyces sp. NPDC002896 TaxID=3154438 RepID=UPI00332D2C1A